MMAASINNIPAIKLLLEKEARLKSAKGNTALMTAAAFGYDDAIELLEKE